MSLGLFPVCICNFFDCSGDIVSLLGFILARPLPPFKHLGLLHQRMASSGLGKCQAQLPVRFFLLLTGFYFPCSLLFLPGSFTVEVVSPRCLCPMAVIPIEEGPPSWWSGAGAPPMTRMLRSLLWTDPLGLLMGASGQGRGCSSRHLVSGPHGSWVQRLPGLSSAENTPSVLPD